MIQPIQFTGIRGVVKLLDANSTEINRYQRLYDAILKTPATQKELAETMGISQAIISTVTRRLINCGILTTVKTKGAKQYSCVCAGKIDTGRLFDAHLVLDAQRQLELLRIKFKNQYGELP